MNRIWHFRKTTPKAVSADWGKIVQSDPKEMLLDSYQKIIQDQVELIDRKNEQIQGYKLREALYIEKVKKLVTYTKLILEERNASKQEEA